MNEEKILIEGKEYDADFLIKMAKRAAKIAAYQKEYREANKEKIAKQIKAAYIRNADKNKALRLANKEAISARNKEKYAMERELIKLAKEHLGK